MKHFWRFTYSAIFIVEIIWKMGLFLFIFYGVRMPIPSILVPKESTQTELFLNISFNCYILVQTSWKSQVGTYHFSNFDLEEMEPGHKFCCICTCIHMHVHTYSHEHTVYL